MRPPPPLPYLLRVGAVLVGVGTLFRLLLLAAALVHWPALHPSAAGLATALLIGLRFDLSVACYALVLPFLWAVMAGWMRLQAPLQRRVVRWYWGITMPVLLLVLTADIPWYLHMGSRLSRAALSWTNDPGYMVGMILRDPGFLGFTALFVLLTAAVLKLLFRLDRGLGATPPNKVGTVLVHLAAAALLFIGLRGRIDEKAPLQPGFAYFGDDPFLNQLGLNAAFNLGASLEKRWTAERRRVALMAPAEAFFMAGKALGAPQAAHLDLRRTVVPDGPPDSLNVVIVLLESMSMHKLGHYGGPTGLTPFLNALAPVSLQCEHAYSAGIHTFNGIHATLYGYPALFDQQPMEDWLDKRQQGLPGVLRDHGYRTLFCTTHDPEFDNMKGFLTSHGFERVISEDDYPAEWIASTNGVPDHRMFDFALPQLDALAAQGPFLSVFMTTSDHKPYILPDSLWFTPRSERVEDRIVEYVDASLGRFIAQAAQRPWGRRTLFVLLGDHGINMGHTYDLPLTFHHTPLLLHTPGGQLSPGRLSAPCGQIDVPATVLGVLNLPWTNATLGVDVRRSPRACMYFCADDRVGCIDEAYYFIRHADGRETLHHHPDLDMRDLAHERPARLDSLRRQAYAMMQVTQELMDRDLLDGPTHPTP